MSNCPAPTQRVSRLLRLAAVSTMALGCNNNQQASTSLVNTALRVEPASFLGSLRCIGQAGGTVGSYVTTLTHLEAASLERPGDGVHSGRTGDLPSSPPVDCHVGATFEASENDPGAGAGGTASIPVGSLIAGEDYVARIDAYDLPACPASLSDGGSEDCLAAASSGVSDVVDQTGGLVLPRWRARCGLDPAMLSVGELEVDAGLPTTDAGIEGLDRFVGGAYRGDLRPAWTTAQVGSVVRLQGCTLLEGAD